MVTIPLFFSYVAYLFGIKKKIISLYFAIFILFINFILTIFLFLDVYYNGVRNYYFGNWRAPLGIEYRIDLLNASFIVFFNFMSFVVALNLLLSNSIDYSKLPIFSTIYLLYISGLTGVTITGDIFNLYVFLEITALSSYALVAIRGGRALLASINYLVLGTIGATFILIGIGYFYMATGTLNMEDLKLRLVLANKGLFVTGFSFFIIGVFIKMAFFPLYHWLPDVYSQSNGSISAILSATGTALGCYMLFRSLYLFLGIIPEIFFDIIRTLSYFAVIFGGIMAIKESKVMKLFAYSTISQIGLIALGISTLNENTFTGSYIHIFANSIMKAVFFMCLTPLQKNRIESVYEVFYIRNVFFKFAFIVASLTIIGVPLTIGFLSKWFIAMGAFKAGKLIAVAAVLLSTLLSGIYIFRVFSKLFFSKDAKFTFSSREFILAGLLAIVLIFSGIFTFPIDISKLIYDQLF